MIESDPFELCIDRDIHFAHQLCAYVDTLAPPTEDSSPILQETTQITTSLNDLKKLKHLPKRQKTEADHVKDEEGTTKIRLIEPLRVSQRKSYREETRYLCPRPVISVTPPHPIMFNV